MDRSEILTKIDNPKLLEKLYRDNKLAFKAEFKLLYPELKDNKLADYWNERLNYENQEISWGSNKELIFVIIAALLAGFIAKLPVLLKIDPEFFYPRNIGFIIFPLLTTYFIWRKGLSTKKIIVALLAIVTAVVFINLFPGNDENDTFILSCIHLPLFLWAVLGFTYVGDDVKNLAKRLDFLRYNGDLVIMTTLILISGAILTAITIGLFSVIGFHIEQFYIEYIVICGAAASPIVGTYIIQTNPQLVNRVSPVIAKIFSPLVLITLIIYLVAILYSGRNPYRDREFLMIFNVLLIGVMAIILFSIAETFKKNENRTSSFILLALSIVTVIVNGIALSAILFRISEWGITPNRIAVMGANILMLTNLLLVSFRLFKYVTKKVDITEVENSISLFLPVYTAWTIIVTFIFPLLFHFS
jgi:hypothetical protein